MRCETAIRRLLLLDHNERPDRRTARHLDRCTSCRAEYEAQRIIMGTLAGTIPGDAQVDPRLTERVMASVRAHAPATELKPPPGDYLAWVGTGLIILTGFSTLSWNPVLGYLHHQTGGTIALSMGIINGLVITVYLSVFIATHLDELSRRARE